MPILLVEVNPEEISIDESLFPDEMKDSFVYEHLKYCCSKNSLLPSISIIVSAAKAFVIRGHQYLFIAKELKYPRIRAIIDKASPEKLVREFLQKPKVVKLDWETVRKEEPDTMIGYSWFIFFFERTLTTAEKNSFEEQIVDFFRQLKLPAFVEIVDERVKNLNYPHAGHCAEFQAFVPIADERWYRSLRSVMIKFHSECIPVFSFQGRKFLTK
jgi:hypothetical protein